VYKFRNNRPVLKAYQRGASELSRIRHLLEYPSHLVYIRPK